MTPYIIAESIFWTTAATFVVLIYQLALLPSIRLKLRYRTFALRDQLRFLIVTGEINESDKSFQLLHDTLNYMCASLSRYDLARLIHSIRTMNDERKAHIEAASKLMESAPEAVKKIYRESVDICFRAFIFNSLFFCVFATPCLGLSLLARVGGQHLKEAFVKKVNEDTQVGFFAPELGVV